MSTSFGPESPLSIYARTQLLATLPGTSGQAMMWHDKLNQSNIPCMNHIQIQDLLQTIYIYLLCAWDQDPIYLAAVRELQTNLLPLPTNNKVYAKWA